MNNMTKKQSFSKEQFKSCFCHDCYARGTSVNGNVFEKDIWSWIEAKVEAEKKQAQIDMADELIVKSCKYQKKHGDETAYWHLQKLRADLTRIKNEK